MADQHMTYAQALNEAKQVILQQAGRIKTDSEKLKSQQQMIVDQTAGMSERDSRLKEQDARIDYLGQENRDLTANLSEATTAREQADTIINRQGERISGLQNTVTELEQRVDEMATQLADLTRERDDLASRLPSQDDAEALAQMAALLSRKVTGAAAAKESRPPGLRLAEAA